MGSARAVIREAVNSAATAVRVEELIGEIFGAETSGVAVCPECGASMKVRVKDAKRIVDSLSELISQGEGRPEQRSSEAVSVVIERPPL